MLRAESQGVWLWYAVIPESGAGSPVSKDGAWAGRLLGLEGCPRAVSREAWKIPELVLPHEGVGLSPYQSRIS